MNDAPALNLWDMSRRHDPPSSKRAAREHVETGRHATQLERVLDDVNGHPGTTAGEISDRIGMERSTVSKRLPELERQRSITRGTERTCRINGRQMMTWWPR